MKKILKKLFKRQQKPTVYKKKFLYTIEKDDIVNDYVYEFETVEAIQNDKMLRQCYEPYNHNITNPEVISICKEYFGSIGYEWESYPERQARYQRENPGRVIF